MAIEIAGSTPSTGRDHADGIATEVHLVHVAGGTATNLSGLNAAAAPGSAVMVGGADTNGDVRRLRTSTAGRPEVDINLMPILAPTVDNAGTEVIGDTVGLYADPSLSVSGASALITDTSDTAVIAAQGAGVRTYVTTIVVANSDATVGTLVAIKDGTTIKMYVPAAPAYGGAIITLPKPLRGSANTAWNAACLTTSAEVRVSMVGFTSEV